MVARTVYTDVLIRGYQNVGYEEVQNDARLDVAGGDSAIAPLKIGIGGLTSVPRPGAIENVGDDILWTDSFGIRHSLLKADTDVDSALNVLMYSKASLMRQEGFSGASAGWYRVAQSKVAVGANEAVFRVYERTYDCIFTVTACISNTSEPTLVVNAVSGYNASGLTKVRVVYKEENQEEYYAYLEVYKAGSASQYIMVESVEPHGWDLVPPVIPGGVPDGCVTVEAEIGMGGIPEKVASVAVNSGTYYITGVTEPNGVQSFDYDVYFNAADGSIHSGAIESGNASFTGTLGVTSTVTLSALGAGVVHSNASGVLTSGKVAMASEVSGILPVANGGTGRSSITAGALLYGNGTGVASVLGIATSGYILKSNGSAPAWSTLADAGIASTGHNHDSIYLKLSGGDITGSLGVASSVTFSSLGAGVVHSNASGVLSSSAVALGSDVSGTLPVANGGTGITSYAKGNIIYATGSTALTTLAIGSQDDVLVVSSSGIPSWVSKAPKATLADTVTTAADTTNTLYVVGVKNSATSELKHDTSVTVKGGTVTATTFSGSLSGGTISGTTLTASSTVTFTGLGTTAGVVHNNASGVLSSSLVSLTADVIGTLPVANGGTGINSYTSGDMLYATGATTLAKLAKGSSGQVLKCDGSKPVWATISDIITSANPTASIGLTTVNGSASTFMRSDAAPAIDVSIAPSWTGKHTFSAGLVVQSTSGDAAKGLNIRRTTGDSEAVQHYLDDSNYHIKYTNDETTNAIKFTLINTDTEGTNTGTNANTSTVTFAGSASGSNVTATKFTGSLVGGTVSCTTLTASSTVTFSGLGTVAGVVHNNASGVLSSGLVSLTADVSGKLPVANGGTGASTLTKYAVLLGNGTGVVSTTAVGTNNYVLIGKGSSAFPEWAEKAPKATDADNASNVGVASTTAKLYVTGVLTSASGNSAVYKDQSVTVEGGTVTATTFSGSLSGGTISGTTLTVSSTATFSGLGTGVAKLANGVLSAGSVDLASSEVTGTLVVTKGGTGVATVAKGDLLYGSASNTWSRLAIGGTSYAGRVLYNTGTLPEWKTLSDAGIATKDHNHDGTYLKLAGGESVTGIVTFTGGLTVSGGDLTVKTLSGALYGDSGVVKASTTTATELGYVHGVTSAIQTQLDNKVTRYRVYNRDTNTTWNGTIPLWILSLKNGYPAYTDTEFESGSNSVSKYNNTSGSTGVVVERVAASGETALDSLGCGNNSGYVIKVTLKGNSSPNYGGFVQSVTSAANKIKVQIFRALLPEGYYFVTASNTLGDGYKDVFLTNPNGTGKWEWYARTCYCGVGTSFSTGGHVSVNRVSDSYPAPTTSAPIVFYIAECNNYDITRGSYAGLRVRYADSSTSVTATSDTTNTLYLAGIKSGDTSTLRYDTSITAAGGTLTANVGIFTSVKVGGGVLLKYADSMLNIRNNADSDWASIKVGNLTVEGTITYINTQDLNVADNIITLNSDVTGTPSENGGIEIKRGTSTNASLIWDESNDVWKCGLVGSESIIVTAANYTDYVKNGNLYLQANGSGVATFTANQSGNTTLNIGTGSSNGTISVGGSDVAVKGLGSNAYSSTAYLPLAGLATVTGLTTFTGGIAIGTTGGVSWATVSSKTPYMGYSSGQNDGTFVIASLSGTGYTTGLAIGGSSGKLLWKSNEVLTTASSANPSASIGLTTVNGSATTFMRSDAAPALSQSIAPTWTGLHTFSGGVYINNTAGSWVSGMTQTKLITFKTTDASNYYPYLRGLTKDNHVWNWGGYANTIGVYGYYAGRTANSYDWRTYWDVSTGKLTHTKDMSVSGAVGLSSTLSVTGATTLSNTLSVTGATTLSSTLDVTGQTTLTGDLSATGVSTIQTLLTDAFTVNPGALLATPVSGRVENDGTALYYTDATGTRYKLGSQTEIDNDLTDIWDQLSLLNNRAWGERMEYEKATAAGWYRIAQLQDRTSASGYFRVSDNTSGSEVLFTAAVKGGTNASLVQVGCAGTTISKARIAYTNGYAFLDVYSSDSTTRLFSVEVIGHKGWKLVSNVPGNYPSGYSIQELTFQSNAIVAPYLYGDGSNITNLPSGSITGIVGVTHGGTGLGSVAKGDLLYGSATDTWDRLGIGSNGYILKSDGTKPVWSPDVYVKLAGSTWTGVMTAWGSQYTDARSGALNMNNSNIYGVNSVIFADKCDNAAEGLQWYRGTDTVDSVWVKDGVMYLTPNRTLGTTTATDYVFLTSGNYTSYVKDGTLHIQASGTDVTTFTANQTGASTFNIATGSTNGTISVGGTDVAVKGLGSNAYSSTSYLPLAGGTMTGVVTVGGASYVAGTGGQGLLAYKPTGWTGVTNTQWAVGTVDSQGIIRSSNTDLIHYKSGVGSTVILDASNYTTYTVTKSGTGATGTWGISISGDAASASTVGVASTTAKLYVTGVLTTASGNSTLYKDESVYVQGGTVGATTFSGTLSGSVSGGTVSCTTLTASSTVKFSGITTSGLLSISSGTVGVTTKLDISQLPTGTGSTQVALGDHTHAAGTITGVYHDKVTLHSGSYTSSSLCLIDRNLVDFSRANKMAFIPADKVTIEFSTNGGSTWTDAGYTNAQKAALFAGNIAGSIRACGTTGDASGITSGHQTKIDITLPSNRYCSMEQFFIWFSGPNSQYDVLLDVYVSTYGAQTTFTKIIEDAQVKGDSGPNMYWFTRRNFWGTNQSAHVYTLRFIFKVGPLKVSEVTRASVVYDIRGYGPNCWSSANSMMKVDHLYSWDTNQNATFPANLTVKGITTAGVVHSNSSGLLSSGKVALASEVDGILPIANGGFGTNAGLTGVVIGSGSGYSAQAGSGNSVTFLAWNGTGYDFRSVSSAGTADSVTTTANTSDTLYVLGVKSGATSTILRNTGLTMKNGTLTGDLSGNASTADAWKTGRTITLSGGVTGTSASWTGSGNLTITTTLSSHASTGTTYGAASASNYGHAKASSTLPVVAGTATTGTETSSFARGDHVHPAQTSVTGSSGSCTGNAASATQVSVTGLATNGNVAYYLTGVQTHSTGAENRSLISTKNVTITGAGSVSMVNLNATGIVTLSGVTTVAGIVKISSAGKLSAGVIDLTSEVSGTLPIGNLPTGTGATQVALGDHTHSAYINKDGSVAFTNPWYYRDINSSTQYYRGTYYCLAQYGPSASSTTGTLIIKMGSSSYAVRRLFKVMILDAESDKSGEILIAGYSSGSNWYYYTVHKSSENLPDVRLVYGTLNNVTAYYVAIGTTSTTWKYLYVSVVSALLGETVVSSERTGWEISLTSTEPTWIATKTPNVTIGVPQPASTDTDKYLKYTSSGLTWATVSGGTGVSSLAGLDDTSITSPTRGSILYYNSSSKWANLNKPTTYSGKILSLDSNGDPSWITNTTTLSGLTDTTISNPANNQILYYNGSKWTQLTAPSTANTYLKYDGSSLGWATVSSGTGATLLSSLGDVSITPSSLVSNQLLYYDASASAWKPLVAPTTANTYLKYTSSGLIWATVSGGGTGVSSLDDLSDVGIQTAMKGDILLYNGSSWENLHGPSGTRVLRATYDSQTQEVTVGWGSTSPAATSATQLYTYVRNNTNTTKNYLLGIASATSGIAAGNKSVYVGSGMNVYFTGAGEVGFNSLKLNGNAGTAGQVLGVNSDGTGVEWVPPGVFKSVLVDCTGTGTTEVTLQAGNAYLFYTSSTGKTEVTVYLPTTYSGIIILIVPNTQRANGTDMKIKFSSNPISSMSLYDLSVWTNPPDGNNHYTSAHTIETRGMAGRNIILVGNPSGTYAGWYGNLT